MIIPQTQKLISLLNESGGTLSVAESCTGGMIGQMITSVAGSSQVFYGGVISYSNDVKETVLGVPHDILLSHGAVSAQTVEYMAQGVRQLMKTSCAISVSGIAGPDGGTAEKPVGLVFIGVWIKQECRSYRHIFSGDRDSIRTQAARAALDHLLSAIMRTQS